MSVNFKKLVSSILLPLIVGGVSAFLTKDNMEIFSTLNKPPLSPPAWLFPVVWTALYILMGVAAYLVKDSGRPKGTSLHFYYLQLFFNFWWSIIFFNMENYLFAFIWLVALWVLVLITTFKFCNVSKTAGYLLLPYILWVTFAGYLNLAIYILN